MEGRERPAEEGLGGGHTEEASGHWRLFGCCWGFSGLAEHWRQQRRAAPRGCHLVSMVSVSLARLV